MANLSKSYWSGMSCRTEHDLKALKSWFAPLCDAMTPVKAEVLCDRDTDREKKLKVLMQDESGRQHLAILSRTKSGSTITLKSADLHQEKERWPRISMIQQTAR